MSVRSIIKDIRTAANSSSVRNLQYENAIFDFTFHKLMTQDEAYDSIGETILNSTGAASLTTAEAKILDSAVKEAFRNVYTTRNIKNVHQHKGYKVFAGRNSYVEQTKLVEYSGFSTSKSGKPKKSLGKAAVYIHHKHSNPGMGGPMVTYAGSMNSATGNENREVINALWFTMIRETLKICRRLSKKGMPTSKKARAGILTGATAKRMGSLGGKSRAWRLHGPTASQEYKYPNLHKTDSGAVDDTSAPVVGMIDALRDVNDNVLASRPPKGILSPTMYAKAFKHITEELDLEFIVNGETITSIVKGQKEIIIKIAQGGQKHQDFMKHADNPNVTNVIDAIEDKLLNSRLGLTNKDYEASKSMSKITEDAVVAQVVKHFTTKSGKPDMRYKVNKQAALNNAKYSREKDSGKLNLFTAGKITRGRTKSAKQSRRKVATSKRSVGGLGTQQNPIALKELINQALPEAMLLKMQPPALRNRTGRFRQSAEVTNVVMGPRGGTQIDYTYMRDPYETFEPGGKMGSRNRDPRKLIGGTVREIATQITGNKFIRTRRQ